MVHKLYLKRICRSFFFFFKKKEKNKRRADSFYCEKARTPIALDWMLKMALLFSVITSSAPDC
jgi:hypothetical protein